MSQTETKWKRLETGSAPENRQKIVVITQSGDERTLVYQDGLLFLPDMSMYVYFSAEFWRPWTEADGE